MATYLVTGAARGIGLELTKQLLELPSTQVDKVFALVRSSPAPKSPLQELLDKYSDRLFAITAAVDNTESVQKAAEEVKAKLASTGKGLDVLVNNAGIAFHHPDGIRNVSAEDMTQLLDVNVIGTQRVTAAFLPLLESGNGGQKKIINMYVLCFFPFLEKMRWSPCLRLLLKKKDTRTKKQ